MQPKEGTRLSYALFHFFSVCVFGGVSHTHTNFHMYRNWVSGG